MVEFRVDRANGLPAYRQLMQQVREGLRLGWLNPGDRLPTVRDVVASSGVNANTVLKAYRQLELEGLIESRQGSGTFIKTALGVVDAEAVAELRVGLVEWVNKARAAGWEDEDMVALMRTVLSEERTEIS